MKIKPAFPTVARENFRSIGRSAQPTLSPDVTDFTGSRSLDMSLAAVPEVRASEVARGRALIADPNYPSRDQMKKIASVLAASCLGCHAERKAAK